MLDILEIREACNKGTMHAYVKNNTIYLENDIGECVKIGECDAKHPDKLESIPNDVVSKIGDANVCSKCKLMNQVGFGGSQVPKYYCTLALNRFIGNNPNVKPDWCPTKEVV